MRPIILEENMHVHVFNRGSEKKNIFLREQDYIRFLFMVLFLQSPEVSFPQIGRYVKVYEQSKDFNVAESQTEKILETRMVKLISFSLLPNHFHLVLEQVGENGISKYMHRIQNGFAKYFNAKYEKSGHLFQGTYKAVEIKDNKQLLYLSTYIHKQAQELKGWERKIDNYPWSSLQDFFENRWGKLLETGIILEQFKNPKEYLQFVYKSPAKEWDDL